MSLRLTLYSPERKLLESKAIESVTLPTREGEIQIFAGHADLIGILETGAIRYALSSKEEAAGVISTGTFEVSQDHVSVMAETVEMGKDIDLDRARRAQKLAEDTLRDSALEPHQFNKYQLKLQRSLIRQQIGGGDAAH